ncbi:MAG TPA: hypothetical protein VIO38_08995 [Rariglobus sp.]
MVDIRAVVFNDVADPSDRLALVYVRQFQKSPEVSGEFRRGAGGRVRLFTRAGRAVSWSLAFGSVTREQSAWLDAHQGRLLCVRDDRGGKLFGSFLASPGQERTWSKDADSVSLDFTELTFSESV